MSKKNWTTEKLFSKLGDKPSEKDYWDYVSALRQITTEEVFLKASALTNSNVISDRIAGIDILAQLGDEPRPFFKKSLKLFFNLLETEKNSKVLLSLLFAVGHNNYKLTKKQVSVLSKFVNAEKTMLREALAFSLLGVNFPKAINCLIVLSDDRSKYTRDWATFGLGTQVDADSKKLRNALWKRVNDKHQDTKLEAIIGLANRNDDRVKPILIKELKNGEYGILLLEAIEKIGDKNTLKAIKKQYDKDKSTKKIPKEWLNDLQETITELENKLKK